MRGVPNSLSPEAQWKRNASRMRASPQHGLSSGARIRTSRALITAARNALGRRAVALATAAMLIVVSSPGSAAPPSDASRIGVLSAPKAAEFQELYEYENAPSLTDASFAYEIDIHRAHVVMLAEQRIISAAEAAHILKGIEVVGRRSQQEPALRTYLVYEAALIKTIGRVAGKMHTGRSRNDLANARNRMFYRDQINRVIESLIGLRLVLAEKAQENLDTVMVVYTHRKSAQPVTLGHYCMALAENVGKSIQRYEELYARMNLNPLGSAASAGTGFAINRERTAELLGFDGLVINTIEGTAAWDHIAEFAADNSLYMASLSRLASEIQNWSSDESGMVELDASFSGISSIMPQKKNPIALERTREASALTLGSLMGILSSMNAIEYQHSAARLALDPKAIDAVVAATHAMTGVIRTLRPNKDRMLEYAAEGFSTMTELSDTIVRETGLDFRDAHEIVAHVVIGAISQGKNASAIDLQMVEEAANATIGRKLGLSQQALAGALDPLKNVERRAGVGGPAASSVQKMIDATSAEVARQADRLRERRARTRVAAEKLQSAVMRAVRSVQEQASPLRGER